MAILEKLSDEQMADVSGGYIQEFEGYPDCMVLDDDGYCRAAFKTRAEAEEYALKNGWSTETITMEQRLEMLGLS